LKNNYKIKKVLRDFLLIHHSEIFCQWFFTRVSW